MTTQFLPARQPFSLRSVIISHGWAQLPPFIFNKETNQLHYVLHLSTQQVIELCIREAPAGIAVDISSELTDSEQEEIAQYVIWMLALDQDFSEFYETVRHEPKLAQAEKKTQGRILRSPTLFEDVVKTILTTNTQWGATKRMTTNLVTQFGEALHHDSNRCAFPMPQRLAATSPDTLREETRLGYRAPYVHELAVRVASGELDLESYKTCHLPTPDLRKELMKIKGIGPYAAANLLMLLGRYDFLTIDSWALKMVSHEWHDGKPIDPAEVESHFKKWGKWKGLAYWFWDWSYKG